MTCFSLWTLLVASCVLSELVSGKPYANKRLGYGQSMDWNFGGWAPMGGAGGGGHHQAFTGLEDLDAFSSTSLLGSGPPVPGPHFSAAPPKVVPHRSPSASSSSIWSSSQQSPPAPIVQSQPPPTPQLLSTSASSHNPYSGSGSSRFRGYEPPQQQSQPSGGYGNGQTASQSAIRVEPKPLKEAQREAYKVIEQLQASAGLKYQEVLQQQRQALRQVANANSHNQKQYGPIPQQQQPQPQQQQQQQQYGGGYGGPPASSSGSTYALPLKEVGKDYVTLPVAVETDRDAILSPQDLHDIEKQVLQGFADGSVLGGDGHQPQQQGGQYGGNSNNGGGHHISVSIPSSKGPPQTYLIPAPSPIQSTSGGHSSGYTSSFMSSLRPKLPSLPNLRPSFISSAIFSSALAPNKKISDILRPLLRKVRPTASANEQGNQGGYGGNNGGVPRIPEGSPYSSQHRPDQLDVIHLIAGTKNGQKPVAYHTNQLVNLDKNNNNNGGGNSQPQPSRGANPQDQRNNQYSRPPQAQQQQQLYGAGPGNAIGPQYNFGQQAPQQQQYNEQQRPAPVLVTSYQQQVEHKPASGLQPQLLDFQTHLQPQLQEFVTAALQESLQEKHPNQQQPQQPQYPQQQSYEVPNAGQPQQQNQNEYIEVVNLPNNGNGNNGGLVQYESPAASPYGPNIVSNNQYVSEQNGPQYVEVQQVQRPQQQIAVVEETYAPAVELPQSPQQYDNSGDGQQQQQQQAQIELYIPQQKSQYQQPGAPNFASGAHGGNNKPSSANSLANLDSALIDLIQQQVPSLFGDQNNGEQQQPQYNQQQQQQPQQPQYEVVQQQQQPQGQIYGQTQYDSDKTNESPAVQQQQAVYEPATQQQQEQQQQQYGGNNDAQYGANEHQSDSDSGNGDSSTYYTPQQEQQPQQQQYENSGNGQQQQPQYNGGYDQQQQSQNNGGYQDEEQQQQQQQSYGDNNANNNEQQQQQQQVSYGEPQSDNSYGGQQQQQQQPVYQPNNNYGQQQQQQVDLSSNNNNYGQGDATPPKYGQRLAQHPSLQLSDSSHVLYGAAEPLDVKILPTATKVTAYGSDGQNDQEANRLYLESSEQSSTSLEAAPQNANAVSGNSKRFTYVKLDDAVAAVAGNGNNKPQSNRFGDRKRTAETDPQQLFHAYYAPESHKPPPGYVRLSVDEFNELFKDADIQYVANQNDGAAASASSTSSASSSSDNAQSRADNAASS